MMKSKLLTVVMAGLLVVALVLNTTAAAGNGIFSNTKVDGTVENLRKTDSTELKEASAGYDGTKKNAYELPDFQNYNCNFTIGDELDYLITDNMSMAELVLANSIQGIVAKTKSQIFLQNTKSDHTYVFDVIRDEYGIKMNKIDSVWDLLKKYKSYIKNSGYVSYVNYSAEKSLEEQQSINSACTIGGIEGWIVVEESLEAKVKEMGFIKKDSGTHELTTFDRYSKSGRLSKNFLVEGSYTIACLRDFGMAVGAMFYFENYEQGMMDVAEYLDYNGMVLGWLHNEPLEVKLYSSMGLLLEPSDWVENLTVLAALGKNDYYKQKEVTRYESDSKNVHYIAFMMSDGDNYSYLQGSPMTDGKYGDSLRGSIPFGWAYACSTAGMAPFFKKYYFEKSSTNNDSFIAALGAGYIHVTGYPKSEYPKFAALTASWMNQCDLKYVLLADETIDANNDSLLNDEYRYTMEEIAKYPNVKGGMLSYGQGYVPKLQGENGSVTWVNDKPFIANKDVLWSTSSTGVTNREIAQWAYKINSYEKDVTKIEGYSFMTVHTWSWKYSDVVKLTSMLDDNVIVVTPTELMELIDKNVPHRDVRYPDVKKYNDLDYSGIKPYVDKADYIDTDYISGMKATDKKVFDFKSDGTQGWVPIAMEGAYDEAKLYIHNGSKALYLNGFNNGVEKSVPNSYFMNKLQLSDTVSKLKLDVVNGFAALRVEILDENGVLHTVSKGFEKLDTAASYVTKEYDISAFKGETVTVLIEQSPYGTNLGNHIILGKIEITD